MEQFFALFLTGITSFFGHHIGERFLTKKGEKKIRLVLKGYQIHHSFWGLLAILTAFISTGLYATALFGYGIGNIWQHKRTHNKANEKGLIFITKHTKNPSNLT